MTDREQYQIHIGILNVVLDIVCLFLGLMRVLSYGKIKMLATRFTIWRLKIPPEYREEPSHEEGGL